MAASAGTGSPACAISASRPVVLSATVLPPVLGPLMMSWRASGSSARVSGTGVARSAPAFEQRMARSREARSSGWRAALQDASPDEKCGPDAVEVVGEAGAGEVRFDLGEDRGAERGWRRPAAPMARVMATRMRWISDCSSSSRRTEFVVLLDGFERLDEDGLAGRGRAVDDAGDLRRNSALTGMTKRSPRTVMRSSWVRAFAASARSDLRRLSSMARCWRSMARRMRRSSGLASSESDAVGLDLAAQGLQQRGEVVLEQRRGERGDAGPACAGGSGRRVRAGCARRRRAR